MKTALPFLLFTTVGVATDHVKEGPDLQLLSQDSLSCQTGGNSIENDNKVDPFTDCDPPEGFSYQEKFNEYLTKKVRLFESLVAEEPSIEEVLPLAQELMNFLPGPVTPERYAGLDPLTMQQKVFQTVGHNEVLKNLLGYVRSKVEKNQSSGGKSYVEGKVLKSSEDPGCREKCHESFKALKDLVENYVCAGYFEDILPFLLDEIEDLCSASAKQESKKNSSYYLHVNFIVGLLCRLVKKWRLLDCLLMFSKPRDADLSTQETDVKHEIVWNELAYKLAVLPDKLSNLLRGAVPEVLRPNLFYKHVGHCCLLLLMTVSDGLKNEVPASLVPASVVLNKICVRSSPEYVLEPILSHLPALASKDPALQRVSQKLFEKLLKGVGKERILRIIFSCDTLRANPRYLIIFVGRDLLSDSFLKNVLCRNMLMDGSEASEVIVNFLWSVESCHSTLKSSLLSLLEVFSNSSLLVSSSLKNHISLVKSILLCITYISASEALQLKSQLLPLILRGVANHIDCLDPEKRTLGMIVGEKCTKVLSPDGPSLAFEYQETDLTRQVADAIESAERKISENINVVPSAVIYSEIINKMLEDLGSQGLIENSLPCSGKKKEKITISRPVENSDEDDDYYEKEGNLKSDAEPEIYEEDLDSDDDEFTPYDMSHDTPLRKVRSPCYPQEVLEYLVEGEVDKVEAALEVCEKIVRSDIPNQDPELGVEMANVLLHLDDMYNLDNFDDNRQNSMTALTVSHPKQCAAFLCNQFYEANYNIRQRHDVLHTIKQSAVELSGTNLQSIGDGNLKQNWTRSLESVTSVKELREFGKERKKSLQQNEKENKMKMLVGHFFYPLIERIEKIEPYMDLLNRDKSLLCDLFHTLGILLHATGDCPSSRKLIRTFLDSTSSIFYHPDNAVRLSYLKSLGLVLTSVEHLPNVLTLSELSDLAEMLSVTINGECGAVSAGLMLMVSECVRQAVEGGARVVDMEPITMRVAKPNIQFK